MNIEVNISQRLKDLRKQFGYSQQRIADKIRVKRCTYQAYEEGRALPPVNVLFDISAAYGLYSLDYLIGINKAREDAKYEMLIAYFKASPEKQKIVDFILNLRR